jgi:hypothetical protein
MATVKEAFTAGHRATTGDEIEQIDFDEGEDVNLLKEWDHHYLVQVSRPEKAGESAAKWRRILGTMAAAASRAAGAPEVAAAERALANWLGAIGPDHTGQSVTTVPMFITTGRVTACG